MSLTFVYLLTAGDGCFYIGMGAKSAKPTIPSYEPYQCCPSKVMRDTKVVKVSPAGKSKLRPDKPKRSKPTSTGATTTTPPPPLPGLKPINKLSAKDSRKTLQQPAKKEDKPKKEAKAKKGFFGSGNYHE